MTLFAFIITSVKHDPKLLSAKFLLPGYDLLEMNSLEHHLLYDNTIA